MAAEVLEQDQRHRAFAAGAAAGAADADGVTDRPFGSSEFPLAMAARPALRLVSGRPPPGERDRADTGRDKMTPA